MLNHTLSAEKTAKPNAKKDVVKIAVPSGLMHELAASDMHGLAKDVIFWVVARHQHADRSTGLHQRLLDKAIGDDARKAIITFIKQSRYIAVALQGKFEKGRQAKRYYLKGAEDLVSHASQHNYEIVCDASCFDSSGFVFRSVDFGPLMDCVKNGFDLLDWNIDRFQAEWSLGFVDEPTLDSDDIDAEVIAEKAEKHADLSSEKLDEIADSHRAAYERFKDERGDRVTVRDGRTYTSVTSLPRWIREQEVKFNGSSETFDISACYWFGLAATERLSMARYGLNLDEIDGFLDLIESGKFYERLAEMTEMPYETADEKRTVKQDVQKFCLFGPIGWHPLWHALKRLSPRMCRTIQWWHRQQFGKSELAYFLQRIECQLMTRGVCRWLADAGLPAVQVHDGAVVPEGAAMVAAQWLSDHSLKLYGRRCRIAVTTTNGKSYV